MGQPRRGKRGTAILGQQSVVLPPEVHEPAEAKALDPEEVLHAPYCGELEGDVTLSRVDVLVEGLQVECSSEVLGMQEIVHPAQEGILDIEALVHAPLVLKVEAEGREGCVIPEIKATLNLEVRSGRGLHPPLGIPGIVVMVDEEESVPPAVVIESFQGGGHMMAVLPEIVKHLEVGLGRGRGAKGQKEDRGHKDMSSFHMSRLKPYCQVE